MSQTSGAPNPSPASAGAPAAAVVPFDKYDHCGAYHWDECARWTGRYNPPLDARFRLVAKQVEAGTTVLDVGCGDGFLLGLLTGAGRRLVGVEMETAALAWAREKLAGEDGWSVLRGSAYALPVPSDTFDVVTMTDVIEHLPAPAASLAEIARVLKPSGRLVLTTPKFRPDRKWDERHEREYRPEEMRAALEPHFERVELSYFWPMRWSRWYSTRYGWHLIRWLSLAFGNPFLGRGAEPEPYGQILALASGPKAAAR